MFATLIGYHYVHKMQIDKEFYEVSHYSIYQVVKVAKEQDFIRLGK